MDILIKCLAVIGAVSVLGSVFLAFLALLCAKEKPTTCYHCDLDSTAKSRLGKISTSDLGLPHKSVSLPGQIEFAQLRGTLEKQPDTRGVPVICRYLLKIQ